jgi:exopolysaccharide production protein ExoY
MRRPLTRNAPLVRCVEVLIVEVNGGVIGELVATELIPQEETRSPKILTSPVKVFPPDASYSARSRASSFSYLFVKRLIDIAVSSCMLLALGPILVVIAAAVRVSSPGPIFYRERRVGHLGKHFTIFKFRSMYTKQYLCDVLKYQESERVQMQRRMDKQCARDPRVTRVGAILRKLSLDELPQLFNILRGDMSLVGPRPVVDAELFHYGDRAIFYKLMVPGLSGLWQVSGRNDVSYPVRVRKDVVYCRRWSPLLDLVILARTMPAVLKGKGAY